MSLEASVIHQQEQELITCAEELRKIRDQTKKLRNNLSRAWESEETQSLLLSIQQNISELEKEIVLCEKLATAISETGTRLRAEEALREESFLWEEGNGLF